MGKLAIILLAVVAIIAIVYVILEKPVSQTQSSQVMNPAGGNMPVGVLVLMAPVGIAVLAIKYLPFLVGLLIVLFVVAYLLSKKRNK